MRGLIFSVKLTRWFAAKHTTKKFFFHHFHFLKIVVMSIESFKSNV